MLYFLFCHRGGRSVERRRLDPGWRGGCGVLDCGREDAIIRETLVLIDLDDVLAVELTCEQCGGSVSCAISCPRQQGGEPRVSGRRVRDAMEIEIGLRESHRAGNIRVALPLAGKGPGGR